SHELRTPLARLLVLLETAELPGAETGDLLAWARSEVGQIGELIDDVLFLSELETGREVVSLGTTPACPVLREVADEIAERAPPPACPGGGGGRGGDPRARDPSRRPRARRVRGGRRAAAAPPDAPRDR